MVWCANRGRRLHLGFWTAYQCHLIATHPARNLSLCHILGDFVRNNIIIKEAEDLSPMYMVDAPGLFDIPFFVRTNLVYYREGVPQFYPMGEAPGGRAQQVQEGQAGQIDQAQRLRQENLERAVTELAEENRQSRAEMAKLTTLMESILKELARGKASTGAGTSGHGGQEEETTGPEEEEGDEQEEEDDNQPEPTEEEPKEPPAQTPAPRRSRRNV
ncbi:histone chaperone ASF1-like [Salvia hispanica]|uniref:histone chaperone ASF1-like n=1 Tax=Salvia hispanica TaxID=49212 RepID=UPI002009A94C|nr:histone chaperone ASF1-like [Salvia hispanica]